MGNKGSTNSKTKSRDKSLQGSQNEVAVEVKARFKKQDLKLLESIWAGLQDDKNHTLDKSTFLKLFPLASGLLGERLYLQFDSSNDGVLDYNEFLTGLGLYVKGSTENRIEFLFNMFDYQHTGQLTRNELMLMLHALIPVDQENSQQGELDEFQFQRHRQSLHASSVGSVESMSADLSMVEQFHPQGQLCATPLDQNHIVAPNQTHPVSSDPHHPAGPRLDINKVPSIPPTEPQSLELIQSPSSHQNNPNPLAQIPSPLPHIDPRLLAEEIRIASLMAQLHDLSDFSDDNHFNVINEISIASRISPEQERLTIVQLVDHAFRTVPFNSPEPGNEEMDWMALEHFHLYISRNPCILEHLQSILDCVTWLQDPRCDQDRFGKDYTKQDTIRVADNQPQVLCCLNCGFNVRNCQWCGSSLVPNSKRTFSTCSNEATGLCSGWTTEGLFKFCIQCGERMQLEPLPLTLHTSPVGDGMFVVSAAQPPNGSPHSHHTPLNSQTHLHEPLNPSAPIRHKSANEPRDLHPHLVLPGLHLPDFTEDDNSVHNLSLTEPSQTMMYEIPESPNHKIHTSQHGYHENGQAFASASTQPRSKRTSSHHNPATPSRHIRPLTTISPFSIPSSTNGVVSTTSSAGIVRTSAGASHFSNLPNSLSAHHHSTTHKQAVHYEGQVFIRSNGILKHLKSRWLLCRGGFLYIFRQREDREPINVMFLEGSFISPLDDDDDEESGKDKDLYGLEIKTKAHRHVFYMKHHDQRQVWLKLLRQANPQIEDFYTFKKQVGKGKFAIVYEASSRLNPDRRYAVKVISKLLMEKPEHLEQLRAEIAIIKLSHHPNIIRLKEMFEDQHNIYLVMPLISGGDMFDRILLRKKFSESTTRIIIWRLLSAIDYLHDREIVHSDIKPENILLLDDDADDNVILADFGLSSFFDPCSLLHKQQGTISYLAPEVLRGEFYSKSIDIYALGVCAYLFLCGELPFQGYNSDEIIESTLRGEIIFGPGWEDISLSARLLVQHLLSPNPTERPSAEQALLDPWFDPIRQETLVLNQRGFKKTFSQHSTSTNTQASDPKYLTSVASSPFEHSKPVSPSTPTISRTPTLAERIKKGRNSIPQDTKSLGITTKDDADLVLISTSPGQL